MMRLRTTLAMTRKDVLDISHNRSTMVMLLTPIFITMVFAVISGRIGSTTPQLLIYNPGHSRISQLVTLAVPQSQTVPANSPAQVVSAFGQGSSPSYILGLIIPTDFDTSLSQGKHPALVLYLNGNEMNEIQREQVMDALTRYTSSVFHPLPLVRITTTMINAPNFNFNLDLGNFYLITALVNLSTVSIALVSTLLVEEKENKTLHMLLASPVSLTDVVIGKLLVGLGYQLIISVAIMTILHGFIGNLLLVFLFVLLIACFGLALSLYAGSIFQTTGGVGGFLGMTGLLFVIPAIYVGPIGELFGNNLELQVLHLLPTYYMIDGLMNALQNQGTLSGVFLNIGIALGFTVACLTRAIWLLHRKATVNATI